MIEASITADLARPAAALRPDAHGHDQDGADAGHALRAADPSRTSHVVEIVSTEEGRVELQDCFVNDGVVYEVSSETVVDDSVVTRSVSAVMVDVDQAEIRKPSLHVDLGIVADARLFITEVGFRVKYFSLEEGIGKMAEWAKKAGPRQSDYFENIEIERNMPPSWKA